MEAFYHNQATLLHFSGHYIERGSGFGALAMDIGQVALPLTLKFIVPAAKRIGKELLVQAAPELIDIATRKKTPKQALKNTVTNTNKKQVGAGRSKFRMSKKRRTATTTTTTRKRRTNVSTFSPKYEIISNLLPTEATHSSLDLFVNPPLLVTFERAFTQKNGPSYSPDGPILEFENLGDRNNFIDLQRTRLEIVASVVQNNGNVLRTHAT